MDILTQDGSTTITQQQFLALHPNISFPVPIPYADYGWYVVAPQGQPACDPITQTVQQGNPVLSGGHWLQTWNVVALDAATAATNLAAAQVTKITSLYNNYLTAIAVPVSFTNAAGVTKTYQADPTSVGNLTYSQLGYAKAQVTPAGFYWVAADNTQVPFTYADLLGLSSAMMAQGWTAFQNLQTKKAAVLLATTTAGIAAVTW